MKKCINLFFIIFVFTNVYPDFVPLEKAKKVAENYYGHYCYEAASKGSSVVNVHEHNYEGIITRYTFEFDKGFVIVTADDELYPILGYSDHGKVPSKDAKGGQNFKEWFENYDRQIACKGSGKYVDNNAVKLWMDIENNVFPQVKSGVVVDRLVKSQWDQLYPWNLMCPEKDGEETYVGCVATAMSQMLRYHRWPDVGEGSSSYEWNGQTLSADFTAHTWNYDLMPEIVDIKWGIYPEYWETGITQAEKDELSLLSYWTGLSVDMMYGTYMNEGSATYASYVDDAFLDHWKASSSVYYTMETPPAGGVDAQFDIIKAELDAKRPWFWAGGAHAFILDGYRDDYWYHFNWGWQGNYDGWFHRSSLVPGGLGSCDTGGGDFTAGQLGITYVPSSEPYDQWPASELQGSVENGDDIKLSWGMNYNAVGYKIYRTYSEYTHYFEQTELLIETPDSEYTDTDLSAGYYSYHIVTVYPDGESHNSNSFSVGISENETYPVIRSLSVEPVGRTNIDLVWTKPFTGTIYQYVDFDSYVMPSGWLDKTSRSGTGLDCWTDDPENWVFIASYYDLYNWLYQNRIDGNILLMSANATETLWFLSPEITFNDDAHISWWNRFRYSDDEGNVIDKRPYFEVVSYSGLFDEINRETNIIYTTHAVYDGSVSPENIWEYMETTDLSSLAGTTTRVGFRVPVNTNDQYTLAFDKITIGAETSETIEQCTGYEIYRNGSLATTISSSTIVCWSDPFFEDGVNEYYIKALYPTGISLPCERVSVTVDKNPKPDHLTVEYQEYMSAELSWYWPYHNPPKWYSYYLPENSTTTVDVSIDPIVKRRTLFKAEDLGFYYPVTLDSVAIGFYDRDGNNWNGHNKYHIRISTGGDGGFDSILYESPELTAVHNQICKHSMVMPLVLDASWNVEVITDETGYPGTLAAPVSTTKTHSYFEYDMGDDISYYYGIKIGGFWYEWLHMSYVTSSPPEPLAKSDESDNENPFIAKAIEIDDPKELKYPVLSFKGLDYFKIYRNGLAVGTTPGLSYTDNPGVIGDYLAYKVTAVYSNPAGESEPSNEVVVFGTGIDDDALLPVEPVLHQNYPNPFNPETTIMYSLSADADVRLAVYDIAGREVAELVSVRQARGNHSVNFNAENLTSGIYFYRLSVDGKAVQSKKMMILK
ncbi:MAG: thiol protease/hemagglutinin PrtT [Candidatus Delongbacteria bacterium]|nr:thiol protease/hemagglutinin PrtT [Candidatus Delongbacteria bacterium]